VPDCSLGGLAARLVEAACWSRFRVSSSSARLWLLLPLAPHSLPDCCLLVRKHSVCLDYPSYSSSGNSTLSLLNPLVFASLPLFSWNTSSGVGGTLREYVNELSDRMNPDENDAERLDRR
jgi:hypothetical protein